MDRSCSSLRNIADTLIRVHHTSNVEFYIPSLNSKTSWLYYYISIHHSDLGGVACNSLLGCRGIHLADTVPSNPNAGPIFPTRDDRSYLTIVEPHTPGPFLTETAFVSLMRYFTTHKIRRRTRMKVWPTKNSKIGPPVVELYCNSDTDPACSRAVAEYTSYTAV